MKTNLYKLTMSLAVVFLFLAAAQSAAFAQGPGGRRFPGGDPAKRVAGQITAISAAAITVKSREGESQSISVTDKTTYNRNRENATLSSFKADDFIVALGSRDANGQFVAEQVMGGDQPPPGPGRGGPRGGRFNGAGGEVTAIDAAAGTLTVKGRNDEVETIYTNAQTSLKRNRQDATLADFKVGDFVRAQGARNENKQFVAASIIGGDQRPDR